MMMFGWYPKNIYNYVDWYHQMVFFLVDVFYHFFNDVCLLISQEKTKWYSRSHILLCSANFIGWYPMISHVFYCCLVPTHMFFFYWGFFLDIIKYPRISNFLCFLFVNPCWFFEKLHHWVLLSSDSIKFPMISPFLGWLNYVKLTFFCSAAQR